MENVEHSHNSTIGFAIKTEVFEGPLELLLSLIEKRKLLISDISLAQVTDEFMKQVEELQQHSLKDTAQFVVVAATLLLIKSKSLLPVFELTQEEEENIDELERRLREYQIYRKAADQLTKQFGTHMLYERCFYRDETPLFVTDKYCDSNALAEALSGVIRELPKKEVKPKVQVRKVVSLEEMMSRLENRIQRQMQFGFKDFTEGGKEKTTVIVGFLAVLEMVKQGQVMVRQVTRFDDIAIEKEVGAVPYYV